MVIAQNVILFKLRIFIRKEGLFVNSAIKIIMFSDIIKKNCSNPSPKSVAGTQTDFSNELDISYKQVRSRKQTKSKKQAISNNNIIDVDPNHLCDQLREILSKPDMSENDHTTSKMILDELLRTKSIPRKDYNATCKNIGLV